MNAEREERLHRYFAGELSASKEKQLARELEGSREAMRDFRRIARFYGNLAGAMSFVSSEIRPTALLRGLEKATSAKSPISSTSHAQEKDSTRRQPAIRLTGAGAILVSCAAAAALFITTGLIALWLSPDSVEKPLTQSEKRRHKVIVEQLRQLNLERNVIETAKKRRRPRPKPAPPSSVPPTPEEAPRAVAEQDAQDAEDAEEVARLIDARRRFVMRQLRSFGERAKRLDDLDIEEFDSHAPDTSREEAATRAGTVEIGRVLAADDGRSGVLIREADEGPQRLQLTKDLPLLSGDRIETAHGKVIPCASVHLKGGATIDIDRATSIELLGRNNVRFHTGRIYAQIAVPYPEDSYPEEGPPFSLETEAGRFLTHDMQAELTRATGQVLRKDFRARVDGGTVHLINRKGLITGRKGQELKVRKGAQPTRAEGFSKPIWRGRERNYRNLPFGRSSPVIFSVSTLGKYYGAYYMVGLAFRGEIRLAGLQSSQGDRQQEPLFESFLVEARKLQRYAPGSFPLPVRGTVSPLRVPASGKFKDTQSLKSAATSQILEQARKAIPARPLVFLCHGSATDLACAWLKEPGIAKRVVVVAAIPLKKSIWWQRDPWAAQIVLRHFRCVLLPSAQMAFDLPRLRRISDPRWASIVNREIPDDHHIRMMCYFVNPDPRFKVTRLRFKGARDEKPVFEPNPKGRVWQVSGVPSVNTVLTEFDRVFLAPPQVRTDR